MSLYLVFFLVCARSDDLKNLSRLLDFMKKNNSSVKIRFDAWIWNLAYLWHSEVGGRTITLLQLHVLATNSTKMQSYASCQEATQPVFLLDFLGFSMKNLSQHCFLLVGRPKCKFSSIVVQNLSFACIYHIFYIQSTITLLFLWKSMNCLYKYVQ